ncbi:TetR/AcrR family transcriptional regulator [Nocardioides speluncae]|uniref:TetR/AcrR family transcriptional regulator n=1 Tax=Nocardioides speluncae TaxID=2670337 RepID=UPI000D686A48|nr:TetR/AcrR family transcriptional regulator [Nocardioides speluncae]
MTTSTTSERPHGREQVTAAIHQAAVELLADRGPREVTVRQIAERAGVNHALVHRHFGSKQALVRSVLETESAAVAAVAARPGVAPADVVRILGEHPAYFRILARTVLDEPELLAERMPVATAFLDQLGERITGDQERRAAAIAAGSVVFGWLVFGPHLMTVFGESDPHQAEAAIAEVVRAVVS